MPAGKSPQNIKKVIDALRKKRMPTSELSKETGIPERTLRRYLTDYLNHWGLAAKDKDGNWAWYETTRFLAPKEDLEIALQHSRKLIPGLDALAVSLTSPELYAGNAKGLTEQDIFALKEAAENHINNGYPRLSAQITNLNYLNVQRKELYENATGEPATDNWSNLLQDLYYFRKLKLNVPKKNLKRVQKLVKIPSNKLALIDELEEQWQKGYFQTSKDIRDLERKIEQGEPLEGKCKLCPAISVGSN